MKPTLKHFTHPRPGATFSDPACAGLRYRTRKGGIFAELRYRTPGGWRSHPLGRLPTGAAEVHAFLLAASQAWEPDDDDDTSRAFGVNDIIAPVRKRAWALREQLQRGTLSLHAPETFAGVADAFLERHVSRLAPRTQADYRAALKRFAARWERKPLAALTRREIAHAIDAITDESGPVAANRALAVLQSMLSWAVNRHLLDASPAAGMRSPNPERPRDRTLSDAELAVLWPAFEAEPYPYGPWAQLLLLTATRITEAARLRWQDVEDLDGPEPRWRVSQKGGRPHLLPLAPQAVALLRGLPRNGEYAFALPSGRPITGFSEAKKRLDKRAPGVAHWTYHDLRRTVRTNLSRLRVAPHVSELCLGHAVTGLIKVYDQYDYFAEKTAALEAWEAHLASVLAGGNVMPMPAARGAA
jgi:integrase